MAAEILHAGLTGEDRLFTSVSTDTRTIQPGALFVALKGPNFNGHEFLQMAAEKRAAGALVCEACETSLPTVRVEDCRRALGSLAAAWRTRQAATVVAVTGSNGKTTVKEMIAAVLSQSAPVHATLGNLNNDIGLPLTLLALRDETYAVIEMGANHPGEIAYLTAIAKPELALITNAGAAHLEGFGDLDGVARAKGEIFSGLSTTGVAILNQDDPRLPVWLDLTRAHKRLTFGFSESADVRLDRTSLRSHWNREGYRQEFVAQTPVGPIPLMLQLAGEHNLRNALCAVAVGIALNLSVADMQEGLASLRAAKGRWQIQTAPSGLCVIDDSYNANPDSMRVAIETLAQAESRRWLVMGDLAELGSEAAKMHAEIGRVAKDAGIDRLWAVGELSREAALVFGEGGRYFADKESLIEALKGQLDRSDRVLVKGSRSAGMEQVVAALMTEGN
jgi:UDP-N-acetylmuramoyl-tripeptide--D-alanyl-D-alanine ligase